MRVRRRVKGKVRQGDVFISELRAFLGKHVDQSRTGVGRD